MIEIEQLAVLDLCAWTGSQLEAARILSFNQISISRNLYKAKAVLGSVGIECLGGDKYSFEDSCQILKAQRKIHQQIRFDQTKCLRIHANCWVRHLLLEPPPEGWIPNQAAIKKFRHCDAIELLDKHVIDAALVANPEAPLDCDSRYHRYPISNQPLFLLVSTCNALASETGLSLAEVSSTTELGHSSFVSKECRRVMERLDSHLFGAQDPRYFHSQKEPPPTTRRYGTAMTMLIRPDLVKINAKMDFLAGDILVVKKELADHPEILKLIAQLRNRLQALQNKINRLEILC